MLRFFCLPLLLLSQCLNGVCQSPERARDLGIEIGVMKPGPLNAITDVSGVQVGHTTLVSGPDIRTGVTAILPHPGNLFQQKVPAAIFIGNGFGKLAGYSQVEELGNIETPIILTNTLSVPVAASGLISYTLQQPGNEEIRSVNPLVGETNDGWLNDIQGRHIREEHVIDAIQKARGGPVGEGNVGAGTGTVCFGYKGGIGTASRRIPEALGGYTVGVLVQTNFGGILEINGIKVGKELKRYPYQQLIQMDADGSCMIVVLTDAPLDARNLKRLAQRGMMGLARTGGIASNGSGDYVIACSTAEENFIPYSDTSHTQMVRVVRNENMTPLFLAVIEATEEAIVNSMLAAVSMTGRDGHEVKAVPVPEILELMGKQNQ
jgi:D-aminopeptidase